MEDKLGRYNQTRNRIKNRADSRVGHDPHQAIVIGSTELQRTDQNQMADANRDADFIRKRGGAPPKEEAVGP